MDGEPAYYMTSKYYMICPATNSVAFVNAMKSFSASQPKKKDAGTKIK
jgi:hypothetical protein